MLTVVVFKTSIYKKKQGYSVLGWEKEEVALAMQNFLICVEMTFAAVLMFYAFSYKDFQDGRQHS
jgi:hypothetical protein